MLVLSACLLVSLSACLLVCLSARLLVCSFACLLACLFAYLLIYFSDCLPVCLSISQDVCLFTVPLLNILLVLLSVSVFLHFKKWRDRATPRRLLARYENAANSRIGGIPLYICVMASGSANGVAASLSAWLNHSSSPACVSSFSYTHFSRHLETMKPMIQNGTPFTIYQE